MNQFDWKKIERGWYADRKNNISAYREKGRKLGSYVTRSDLLGHAPRFKTMREAMKDAEKRFLERTKQ